MNGWGEVKLRDLTTKIGSGVTPRGGFEVFSDKGVLFIRSQNVRDGKLDLSNRTYIPESIDREMQASRVQKGDILYNITGASIGRTAVYDRDEPANVNQHVCIVRVDPTKAVSKYVGYLLGSEVAKRHLWSFQAGGNREGLNYAQLGSYKFKLSPIKMQRQIVETIEIWDQYITSINSYIDRIAVFKEGLCEFLLSPRNIRPNQDGTEWTPYILRDICSIARGGSPRPIEDYLISNSEDGYSWLRIGDIRPGERQITRTSQKIRAEGLSKTTLVKSGDFILSNSMSFGRPYIMATDACIHDGWLALKNINDELIDKTFLYYLLMSRTMQARFKAMSAGSGVKNLKKETVSMLAVVVPSLQVQKRIAAALSNVDSQIEDMHRIAKASSLQRQYLLKHLLNGDLSVPENLVPVDSTAKEPA